VQAQALYQVSCGALDGSVAALIVDDLTVDVDRLLMASYRPTVERGDHREHSISCGA
jgi:hypothetical protein